MQGSGFDIIVLIHVLCLYKYQIPKYEMTKIKCTCPYFGIFTKICTHIAKKKSFFSLNFEKTLKYLVISYDIRCVT